MQAPAINLSRFSMTQITNMPSLDFGIFLTFVITNWLLVYFFIYTVRVRGWSFGFGTLFGGLGKLVNLMKRPFQRKQKVTENEKA